MKTKNGSRRAHLQAIVAGLFISVLLGPLVAMAQKCATGNCADSKIGDAVIWSWEGSTLQRKPALELRDWDNAGVYCNGLHDSGPFIMSLVGTTDTTGTSMTISGRDCPFLRCDHCVIHGQEYLELDFGPKGPAGRGQGGTWVFGCEGSGAVIQVDRSGFSYIHGGVIAANSFLCPNHSSSLTASIEYTNVGSDGYTSTHNVLSDTILTAGMNGEQVSGYRAYWIHGAPNQEEYRLQNVEMDCQSSPGSIGFISDDPNADSTSWDGGGMLDCYRGIEMDAGSLALYNLNSSYNGGFSVFGRGGASIYETGGCVNVIQHSKWSEGSGQVLNMNNDSNSHNNCGGVRDWRDSSFGFDDIDPAVYPVNLNAGSLMLAADAFITGKPISQIHNGVLIGTDDPTIPGITITVINLGFSGGQAAGTPIPLVLPNTYTYFGLPGLAQDARPQKPPRTSGQHLSTGDVK